MKTDKNLRNLVFEIGTEELPATHLADIFESPAENSLKTKWEKAFENNRIEFQRAEVWATPRRLVFYLEGVASSQTPHDQLTRLMTDAEAYDDKRKPTEKFLTILKHRNVSLGQTVVEEFNAKPYVYIKKAEGVQKTVTILPRILETFVPTLSFPKNMKWDESGLYFARPIRSTLCFYGAQCVRYKIGSTPSDDKTFIFSKSKRSAHLVTDVSAYFRVLKKQGVCLDPEERKKMIQAILDGLAKTFHGKLYDDPFLLNEVNFLVENPQGLTAPFNEQFLKLPLEVLTVSMARKQRIFGLVGKDQNLLPRFLAIADRPMSEKQRKLISQNYENILHAKLQDSLFFYREDLKIPLEKKREELKNLIFLKNAGSMFDKSERLEQLAEFLGSQLLSDEEVPVVKRAARFSKADLLTQMIGEFPELQGIMGRYYAKANGESESVTTAIGEQYLPRTVSDRLPSTRPGALLSMLDKADLIVACHLLDLTPTSSADPYGLRRSGAAIVKIALDKSYRFSLPQLIGKILSLHPTSHPKHSREKIEQQLCDKAGFFWDRFRGVVVGNELGGDVVDAAMGVGKYQICEGFVEVHQRALKIEAIRREAVKRPVDTNGKPHYFYQACKVMERTHNILKGCDPQSLPPKPNQALFAEPLEHAVMEKFEQNEAAISNAKKEEDFAKATSLYAGAFFDILNEFFDKVFINAEDLSVRKNRLSLLKSVKELYAWDIADLSKIQEKF